MTTVELTYRPTTHDLADGRLEFHEPETLTLEDVEELEAGEYAGDRLKGRTPDGLDVVVFAGSDRVRAREADEGTYSRFLGYAASVEVLA
jgi:hypothetical protein